MLEMVSLSITYLFSSLWGECQQCTLIYKWVVPFGWDTEDEDVALPNPGKNAYCKECWLSLYFSKSSSLLPTQSLCTCCSLCSSPRAPEGLVVSIFRGALVPPPQRRCPWPLCLKWFLLLFVMLSYFIFFIAFITTPNHCVICFLCNLLLTESFYIILKELT